MDKIIRRPPKMKLIGLERWSYLEPPKFKRIFPPEIPGATSDWDFATSGWQLDTSTYVSSPSSLSTYCPVILCKYAGTTNISQGRIVTYAKEMGNWKTFWAAQFDFHFRNQTALGSTPSKSAGYYVMIDAINQAIKIARDDTALITITSFLNSPSDISQWNYYRVTWWTDPGGAGLMIRLEWWDGSSWVKMINDFNDPLDKYASSSINRVGIGSENGATYFDDTEIWSA